MKSPAPVRAMVMAAGAGTRLHPLTYVVPKPMVPIANRPVLEYTIRNLHKHGITDIIMNLHNHPDLIREYFRDGAAFGVRIQYSFEPKLLGTAGGVKKVESFLNGGTFLVMSGDGLTDADLTGLLNFHRRRRSLGTMALTRADSRFEYGITMIHPSGRIARFVEKPSWSDVFTNQVNTGIYVFEPAVFRAMPNGVEYDFGHQLWPKLLQQKQPIYGYEIKDYWCDVGNLNEYRRAQRDVLDGKVRIAKPQIRRTKGVWIDSGTKVGSGVKFDSPCLIGKNCRIESEARIGAYTIIGDNARIGRGSVLRNCTLWDGVRVDRGVHLDNCVIGQSAHVKENISVYEGSVINISN